MVSILHTRNKKNQLHVILHTCSDRRRRSTKPERTYRVKSPSKPPKGATCILNSCPLSPVTKLFSMSFLSPIHQNHHRLREILYLVYFFVCNPTFTRYSCTNLPVLHISIYAANPPLNHLFYQPPTISHSTT
jgi:hypothetical protein